MTAPAKSPQQDHAASNRAKGSWKLDLIAGVISDARLSASEKVYMAALLPFADNSASPIFLPRREGKILTGGLDESTQRKSAKRLVETKWLDSCGFNAAGIEVYTCTASCMFDVSDAKQIALHQLKEAKAIERLSARSRRRTAKAKAVVSDNSDGWKALTQDELSGRKPDDDLHLSGRKPLPNSGENPSNPLEGIPGISGIEKKERRELVINRDSSPAFNLYEEASRGAA